LNIPDKATLKDVAEALNGRRVGINAAGTNGERFAQSLILAGGVDPKNVTFIAVGAPPSALAAFSSNNIDAAFSWEPFQAVSVLKGIGRIAIDCRVAGQCPAALEKPGRAFQTYYTTKAFLDSNKEAVEGFIGIAPCSVELCEAVVAVNDIYAAFAVWTRARLLVSFS
jgi:ABC-type nitrate/sulfonate/bicarbonate transport system substrate-binding protein